MACTGTYLGNCCGPAPVPMVISTTVTAPGFACADLTNPYQLYAYAEYGVNWDYTVGGQRYSGQASRVGWFDENATSPAFAFGGDPYPSILDTLVDFASFEYIGETDIVIKWWNNGDGPVGCGFGDLMATGFYRVSDPRTPAHQLATERVNAFDPSGPAVPGIVVQPGAFNSAIVNSGRIPNAPRREIVCQLLAISNAWQLVWHRITANARRVIVTPDTTRKLRLKPYDKTFGNVTTFGPCSSLDLDTGLDISAPYLTPGMAETGIDLSVHLKTSGDPCLL